MWIEYYHLKHSENDPRKYALQTAGVHVKIAEFGFQTKSVEKNPREWGLGTGVLREIPCKS